MKNHISANAATYEPQTHKTFVGALSAFFSEECPQLGGQRTRKVLVDSIFKMVRDFFPETSHLGQGQMPWVTVHKDAKSSYGKTITQTPLTSVVLDIVQPTKDAEDRAGGKKLMVMKKEAVARLCIQAYEQDGCLTNAELAIILKISPVTVGKYIKTWEIENNSVLPRRGSIHDMGPTLTHKKIIINKLFIEKKTVQAVSRETYHSLAAIQRYIGTFRKVLICWHNGMNIDEIAFAVGHTKRLIKQYEEIIDEYREQGHIIENLIDCDVNIESDFERAIQQLQNTN